MVKAKQKKDGTWRTSIYIGKDVYGKKKYKDIYGKTEKECNDKTIEFLYKLKKGEVTEIKKQLKNNTFEESYDEFVKQKLDEGEISDNTYQEYLSVKNCHLKKLLKIPMNSLTNAMIKKFYIDLKKEKGEKIVIRVSQKLNHFLKSKIQDENYNIPRNLLDNLKLPKRKKAKHYIIKENEYKNFLNILKNEFYDENSYIGFLYPLVLVAGGCGLRIGEALAIDMKDINLKDNYIAINKHQNNIKGKGYIIVEGAKTESGIRKVAIPKFIKKELVDIITYNKKMQNKIKLINKNFISPTVTYLQKNGNEIKISTFNFLITSKKFRLIPKNTAERNWKIFRENLGYTEQVRIHDMRRFLATLFLKKGIPNKIAIAQMGHAIEEDTEYYQDVDIDIQNTYIKDLTI